MHSLRELFKVGNGPSSSHTIGPKKACTIFLNRFPEMTKMEVILYGSLALTGKGHLTDYIIEKTAGNIPCRIIMEPLTEVPHPNTMKFIAFTNSENIGEMTFYSVGGGAIRIAGEEEILANHIYPHKKYVEIGAFCQEKRLTLSQYVDKYEDKYFNEFMEHIYEVMKSAIARGLSVDGVLPGVLEIKRKAKQIYNKVDTRDILRQKMIAYAYAVSEENASGGEIVTAPTCGAAGVLPACLGYAEDTNDFTHKEIINALKVAGLIGNIVKFNASISGAEAGCQAEVGTACAMSAAFLSYLYGGDIARIDSASEIALEHHLGLTCDPIKGYVQIPCIERNAVAAMRALDAANLASFLNNNDAKITFDTVVETMLDTGKDLQPSYRETSEGGLAKKFL